MWTHAKVYIGECSSNFHLDINLFQLVDLSKCFFVGFIYRQYDNLICIFNINQVNCYEFVLLYILICEIACLFL